MFHPFSNQFRSGNKWAVFALSGALCPVSDLFHLIGKLNGGKLLVANGKISQHQQTTYHRLFIFRKIASRSRLSQKQ